jgi:trehalose/maltose hydrolase-like predicted phosphorylase
MLRLSVVRSGVAGVANDWTLTYDGFDADSEGLREALCTLGNGRFATRGAAPESNADGVHYPGTYAAGCYNRLIDTVAGEQVENESLVNLPNWLPLTFCANDGPWLGEPGVDILDERRELDLRRGVLTRRLRVRDTSSRTTSVTQRRFVHMRHPYLCGLQMIVTAENWSGTLGIRSWLDANVTNSGVARYRSLAGRHYSPVRMESVGTDTALLVVQTGQSQMRVAQAGRTRLVDHDGRSDAHPINDNGHIGHELRVEIKLGAPVTVDKLVTSFTSRDAAIADAATEALQRLDWIGDFNTALTEHVRAWERLWRRFRIVLDGPGERVLPVVRLDLFHILQTVSPQTMGLDVGLPARGLHGEAYRGHVLWDELFVLPILNLRLPSLTRSLLLYRYHRLPWARHEAVEEGRVGAAYPWQSGSDGREESQRLHLNPVSGRWTHDATRRQRHIGLAVAYNVWQYYQVTEDMRFMNDYGAEMMIEVARFFTSLAALDSDRGRYVIRGVMGPDEFHTGYPDRPEEGIDNNAYTNVMTVWVLRRALEVLRLLPEQRRAELMESLGVDPGEPGRWDAVASRMYVPVRRDGIICQFEGYDDLAELPWDDYRRRYGDIRRLDRILEAEGDSPNRYKASKQADVLMLFYLLSTDELYELFGQLGYPLEPDAVTRNVDYYSARTSHGSTLSAVVHSWVLARNRRDRALAYFIEALDTDVADVQGGTTSEGIHLAAMAGSVDILQRCFAGVETRGDTLRLNPYWPEHLGTLEFDINYRGHSLTLRVNGRSVRAFAHPGRHRPILLCCGTERAWLGPGESIVFRGCRPT